MKWPIFIIAIALTQKEAFGGEETRTPSRSRRSMNDKPKDMYKLDFFIELIEKIERHPLIPERTHLRVIANYVRNLGYNDQKWNKLLGKSKSLPDGILTADDKRVLRGMLVHGFSGQQEHGVVNTPHGDVAMGRVITGICSGINRKKDLILQEIYGLSSKHIDNLYAASIAGDIAETGMLHKIKASKPPLFGPGGTWSPNIECPEHFTLLTAAYSAATDAEILGGIDGFLMGLKIQEWWSAGGVRLGQLLRMYYHDGVVYNKNYAACRRFDMFLEMAGKRELIEQTMLAMYAVKNAWNDGVDFSGIQTSTIPKLAHTTTEHFLTYLKSKLKSKGTVCPASKEECEQPANLVFVMDESGSIQLSNYKIEKDFVKNITDAFEISPYQTRVAVVEYSSTVQVSIKLNQYASKSRLKCVVDGLQYSGGSTYTNKGLQAAHDILQEAQNSKEYNNFPQIIVLLTDGQSTGGKEVLEQAVKTVKENITNLLIVSVGIANYKMSELKLIATDPTQHVLTATDFSKLVTLLKSLRKQSCEAHVILKPTTIKAQKEGENKDKVKAEVSGYVSPGKARYFTLPAESLVKQENISIQVKPTYGSVTMYLSRTNKSPGPDNHDFKLEVGDASISRRRKRSTSTQGNQRVLQLFDVCKGYNATNCPPLYIAVVGKNSSQSCTDRDCSVPTQIKFEINTEQIIPKKESLCYFELEAAKIYKAKDVSLKISAVNDTISFLISRSPINPDSFNNSYRTQQVASGHLKIALIPTPCKGYDKASCPSVYFFFRGSQLTCSCTGGHCTLPSQVKIEVNVEVEDKKKDKDKDKDKVDVEPKVCYHRLGFQQLFGHRMIEIKVSPVKDTITLYASRVNKHPDKSNYTQKIGSIGVGQTKSLNISHPCKGFDKSKCPSLYLTVIGHQLSCNCTAEVGNRACALPEEVSIFFTQGHPSSTSTLQNSVCLIIITSILSFLFK